MYELIDPDGFVSYPGYACGHCPYIVGIASRGAGTAEGALVRAPDGTVPATISDEEFADDWIDGFSSSTSVVGVTVDAVGGEVADVALDVVEIK